MNFRFFSVLAVLIGSCCYFFFSWIP